ncbi:MAG: winged helix-turn-helix domain-containing protein [Candidatus Aenigmatarchaeota archaeon]
MEDEKITLDVKAFRTLASDSRIAILKSLDERRRTLTELSKKFNLSASTVKEHMEKLTEADLVRMLDDGHKWKYYELTSKGRQILHPGTTKIWVLLAISAFGLFYVFWDMARVLPGLQRSLMLSESSSDVIAAAPEAAKAVAGTGANVQLAGAAMPIYHLIGFVAFSIVIGAAIAMLYYTRRNLRV